VIEQTGSSRQQQDEGNSIAYIDLVDDDEWAQ